MINLIKLAMDAKSAVYGFTRRHLHPSDDERRPERSVRRRRQRLIPFSFHNKTLVSGPAFYYTLVVMLPAVFPILNQSLIPQRFLAIVKSEKNG